MFKYRKGRHFKHLKDEIVFLIDEGSESGSKFMSAVKTVLSMKPKAVYIGVAVLPSDVLELLEVLVDDIFYVSELENFKHTPCYYEKLEKISDERIEEILGEVNEL